MHTKIKRHYGLYTVKRILQYSIGTTNHRLYYKVFYLHLVSHSNTNWANKLNEYKSKSNYALLLDDVAISSNNKKQSCVALPTVKLGILLI